MQSSIIFTLSFLFSCFAWGENFRFTNTLGIPNTFASPNTLHATIQDGPTIEDITYSSLNFRRNEWTGKFSARVKNIDDGDSVSFRTWRVASSLMCRFDNDMNTYGLGGLDIGGSTSANGGNEWQTRLEFGFDIFDFSNLTITSRLELRQPVLNPVGTSRATHFTGGSTLSWNIDSATQALQSFNVDYTNNVTINRARLALSKWFGEQFSIKAGYVVEQQNTAYLGQAYVSKSADISFDYSFM